ncbi:hypothetical protein [Membranihabitans marinus]|uniref:hypothetical protein n=1 Tax=Membranihabitans marinus TaxID=1227546 RepID=UPI001F177595|nr:hypothetical protein [Membranihabitans marinus]
MISMLKISVVALILGIVACTTPEKGVQNIPFKTTIDSSLPFLFANNNTLHLSWVEIVNDTTSEMRTSTLENNVWQESDLINRGSHWFLNWADFPMIVSNKGNLMAHNLKKSSDKKFAYDIELNLKPGNASEWLQGQPLHNDSTPTEHGFVSAQPYGDHSFYITWLDGRHMVDTGSSSEMNIRAAEVDFNGRVIRDDIIDDKTCSCCQTSIAITQSGPIVVYRDKADDDIRDIYITRLVDDQWTTPQAIHPDRWEIKGCPVNGPKADAIGDDLAVAWYTAVDNQPKVKLVFSNDGGQHFDPPIIISEVMPLGRLDCIQLEDKSALVSWMEADEEEVYLKAIKIYQSGEKSSPITISQMNGSRQSGFPQMERLGKIVYFAWTDIKNELKSIQTAMVNIEEFK